MIQVFSVVVVLLLFNELTIGQTFLPTETGSSRTSLFPNATSTANATTTPAPTWPTASFPTFPPEFSDIPKETLACWESWANYMLRRSAPNPGILTSQSTSFSDSTYPSPSYRTDTYLVTYAANQTDILVGLTTLCDGAPRASSISHIYDWRTSWHNNTFTYYGTRIYSTITGVTKTGYEVVEPTCTVATNDSPLCGRINSAYWWWLSSSASGSPSPTPFNGDLAMPSCVDIVPTSPGHKLTCAVYAENGHEVHYWPTPTPTGTDFCNSSWTPVTQTPTIPGKPNTAVVSGQTLTSPSLYHFIPSISLLTLAGTRTVINPTIWIPTRSVFSPYSPTPTLLTIPKLESDILSMYTAYSRKARNYKYSFSKDFKVQDVFTMRKEAWLKQVNRPLPILQEEYAPLLGVEIGDVVREVKGLEECVWVKTETRPRLGEVHLDGRVERTDFRAIGTPTGEGVEARETGRVVESG